MSSLVFSSIIAVIIGFVGIRIHKLYRDRVIYLEDYSAFLDELIEEISFMKSPLDVFVTRVSEYKRRAFKETLDKYRNCIATGRPFVVDTNILTNKDKIIIQNCFNNIGKSDATTELYSIKNYSIEAKDMLSRAKYELKTKGELASKLSILLGIAIMILLV